MRISAVLLARAVRPPRVAAKLADLARQDSKRSWSRKTAQVLEIALRNEAPLDWGIIRRFAELPPYKEDVRPLLPLLEAKALNECNSSIPSKNVAMDLIGDLANELDISEALSARFLLRWIVVLRTTNPFKAIRIWKDLPSSDRAASKELGASLYLAANQPETAAALVNEQSSISSRTMRGLISKFIQSGDIEAAQRWIHRWQAPLPEDVRWLHHEVRCHNLVDKLTLPAIAETVYFPNARTAVGPRMQNIVSKVNSIIAAHPVLLENEKFHDQWHLAMTDPTASNIYSLVSGTAELCASLQPPTSSDVNQSEIDTWMQLLRLVKPSTAIKVLLVLHALLPPRAFATVISRARNSAELKEVLRLISPEQLYTVECLDALALREPRAFLELIVPPELLETTLTEHHLVALWTADPLQEVQEWLIPLTLKQLDSARLLRAALLCLAKQQNASVARQLLHEFVVTRGLKLDPRVLQRGKKLKLPRPQTATRSVEEATEEVDNAITTLFPQGSTGSTPNSMPSTGPASNDSL